MSARLRVLATVIGIAALAGCAQGVPASPTTATPQAGPASWTTVTSPNPPDSRNNQLYGVSCVSADDCWAVGWSEHEQPMVVETLIESYTDSGWNIVPSPNPSPAPYPGPNGLFGVSCLAVSDCWAVGANAESLALIEEYTGSGWTIAASPMGGGALQGVTCPSADDCWAVGVDIEHYDGTGWAITASPAGVSLNSVTCASADDCWAVGSAVEHYAGGSWEVVSSPAGEPLKGVACAGADACWAVGSDIQQYNGTGWQTVASPSAFELDGVTCANADSCWAVGSSGAAAGVPSRAVVEQYVGGVWKLVTSPESSSDPQLQAVTCLNANECWGVGWFFATQESLIEQSASADP